MTPQDRFTFATHAADSRRKSSVVIDQNVLHGVSPSNCQMGADAASDLEDDSVL